MRKIFLLVCGFLICSAVSAQESVAASSQEVQPNATEQQVDKEGIHPYREVDSFSDQFTHWSLTFEGGINMFDGDFSQKKGSLFPRAMVRPSGAFSLAYDFTPTWSLIGMYSFAPYGQGRFLTGDSVKTDEVAGNMHTLSLLLGYNLVDAWFPQRKSNVFSLYALAGLGMGIYNYDYRDFEGNHVYPSGSDKDKYSMVGVISVGLAAEFNVSRSLGIGLKGLYHIYTSDDIEGKKNGRVNDCMEYATVYLRWKIDSKKKTQVRNTHSEVYDAIAIAESTNPHMADVRQEKAVKDTLYIITKDTIFSTVEDAVLDEKIETIVAEKLGNYRPQVQCSYIYFANNQFDLTDAGLQSIQQLAAQLQADTALCAEISGYCDNTGSEDYNQALSQRRMERVIRELTNVYGISEERVISIYKGVVKNVDASYSPNRRVEMRLISKDELEALREANPQTTLAEDAVLKEHAVLETIVSTPNTSFYRLAVKYYDNAYCWPYIYAANRNVARNDNPDFIFADVEIAIPQLSEEEINAAHAYTVDAMVAAIRK